MKKLFLLLALLLYSAPTSAQTPVWTVYVPASPDHDVVVQATQVVLRYEVQATLVGGAASPSFSIGKPALQASCTPPGSAPLSNCITADISTYVNALPPGNYTITATAFGSGAPGVSPPSAPFPLTVPAPRAPGQPVPSKSGG